MQQAAATNQWPAAMAAHNYQYGGWGGPEEDSSATTPAASSSARSWMLLALFGFLVLAFVFVFWGSTPSWYSYRHTCQRYDDLSDDDDDDDDGEEFFGADAPAAAAVAPKPAEAPKSSAANIFQLVTDKVNEKRQQKKPAAAVPSTPTPTPAAKSPAALPKTPTTKVEGYTATLATVHEVPTATGAAKKQRR